MTRRITKQILCLLVAFSLVFSLLPATAYAASSLNAIVVRHTNAEYAAPADWWFQINGNTPLAQLTMEHTPKDGVWFLDDEVPNLPNELNLRIWSQDMAAAGEEKNPEVTPYFVRYGDDGRQLEKYVLKEIKILPSDSPTQYGKNDFGKVLEGTTVTKEELRDVADERGVPVILFVWEPDTDFTPVQMYEVSYSLNGGSVSAKLPQLPRSATVNSSSGNTYKANASITPVPAKVADESTYTVGPESDKTATYKSTYSGTDYKLIGWKCADSSCEKCNGENPTYHKTGDSVVISSNMLNRGKVTFTAQWAESKLPSLDELTIPTETERFLLLAEVGDNGKTAQITQSGEGERAQFIGSELQLDPDKQVISYSATVYMSKSVASMLQRQPASEGFAQFQINVEMSDKLELIGADENGNVSFTFTCPFLRPVRDREILVDGEPVEGVTFEGDGVYTYTVPAKAISDDNGGVKPFTFVVEWRPANGGYSDQQLSAAMMLETANLKVIGNHKEAFEAKGSVTGWINPNCLERNQDILAKFILENSPNMKAYLAGKGVTDTDDAAQIVLEYMNTDEGKKATMERTTVLLEAAGEVAYNPCVVTFVNGNNRIDIQYIKYEKPATPTDKLPAYSGGMDFNGWYYEKDGNLVPFNFATDVVTDDITLIAQWSDHMHRYRDDDWTVIEPTCTTPGERYHTCIVEGCGYVARETTSSALGHNYGDWVTEREATYTQTGLRVRTCTRCGERDEEVLPMLNQPYIPVSPTPTPSTPSNPTPTPTPTPGVTIVDEDVPLANVTGLDNTDHFAYIKGYEDGTVRPMKNITRAEVATIFFRLMTDDYRAANWSTTNSFTDVTADAWYNAAISTAARAGILKGYTDGSVKPNADITRAEFATIAARFISDDVTDDGVGDFSDTATHWAAKEIRLAAKAGWVQGDGNRFRPDDPITRAEVMTIVNRMLDRVPSEDNMLPGMKTWSDNPVGTWYYAAVQEATNDHHHERAEDGVTEIWTELAEAKDWDALEAQWSANGGRTTASSETQRPSWLG